MINKTGTKIRLRLESFQPELLKTSCSKIGDLIKSTDGTKVSVISLPTEKRIYCVLKSPHVDKDSREHFEIRIHKKIIEIYYDPNIQIFELISNIDLPAGIFSRIDIS